MAEQHLLSFVLYRTFFNKTLLQGRNSISLCEEYVLWRYIIWHTMVFLKLMAKLALAEIWWLFPRQCSLDTGSTWIVLHFAFLHFELLSSEYGMWWLPELIASVQCLISTHYINTWLVCRNAYLSQEIRDCEVRKKTFAYSTCSIKILSLITLMLHLISTILFPSASSD